MPVTGQGLVIMLTVGQMRVLRPELDNSGCILVEFDSITEALRMDFKGIALQLGEHALRQGEFSLLGRETRISSRFLALFHAYLEVHFI